MRWPDGARLFDSYHCSRYNTNTRRLTTDMFESVFASISRHLGAAARADERRVMPDA